MEGSIEVPSFFLCPISLQIMRDPVTLPTGITYDRRAIERWIFTENHPTCPITNQPLPSDSDYLITPNVTLRRLIQAWCITNASSSSQSIERFPTRPPVTKAYISDLIKNSSSSSLVTSLRTLKSAVSESESNKRCVRESTEAIDFLASIIEEGNSNSNSNNTTSNDDDEEEEIDEALHILYSLQLKEDGVARLFDAKPEFVEESLTAVLRRSNSQCRLYAILLLKSLFMVTCRSKMVGLKEEVLVQVVKVLKDKISYRATKAALQVLGIVTLFGRNKVKAVEACAVPVLIDLLLDETDKKSCEMMLVVLSRLSECPEGRAEIVGHAAGIAVVSKKLVRFSLTATERAVKIMHAIAKFSPAGSAVSKEMLEVGVVSKLCLLVQVDCGEKTKERAREMMRLHARLWRNSACISPQLRNSYPSNSQENN